MQSQPAEDASPTLVVDQQRSGVAVGYQPRRFRDRTAMQPYPALTQSPQPISEPLSARVEFASETSSEEGGEGIRDRHRDGDGETVQRRYQCSLTRSNAISQRGKNVAWAAHVQGGRHRANYNPYLPDHLPPEVSGKRQPPRQQPPRQQPPQQQQQPPRQQPPAFPVFEPSSDATGEHNIRRQPSAASVQNRLSTSPPGLQSRLSVRSARSVRSGQGPALDCRCSPVPAAPRSTAESVYSQAGSQFSSAARDLVRHPTIRGLAKLGAELALVSRHKSHR